MSGLLFRLEDHFYFLAERNRGLLTCAIFRSLSGFFAFAGDVLHAGAGRARPF